MGELLSVLFWILVFLGIVLVVPGVVAAQAIRVETERAGVVPSGQVTPRAVFWAASDALFFASLATFPTLVSSRSIDHLRPPFLVVPIPVAVFFTVGGVVTLGVLVRSKAAVPPVAAGVAALGKIVLAALVVGLAQGAWLAVADRGWGGEFGDKELTLAVTTAAVFALPPMLLGAFFGRRRATVLPGERTPLLETSSRELLVRCVRRFRAILTRGLPGVLPSLGKGVVALALLLGLGALLPPWFVFVAAAVLFALPQAELLAVFTRAATGDAARPMAIAPKLIPWTFLLFVLPVGLDVLATAKIHGLPPQGGSVWSDCLVLGWLAITLPLVLAWTRYGLGPAALACGGELPAAIDRATVVGRRRGGLVAVLFALPMFLLASSPLHVHLVEARHAREAFKAARRAPEAAPVWVSALGASLVERPWVLALEVARVAAAAVIGSAAAVTVFVVLREDRTGSAPPPARRRQGGQAPR